MVSIKIALQFGNNGGGYIGLPFWSARNSLINIGKDVHPKLGEQKKQQAILAACEKRGITPERYQELIEEAARPFYTVGGVRSAEIVIPERIYRSFLNHASMKAPKAVPSLKEKGLTFVGIHVVDGHLMTGKTEKDAKLFERFVKLEESNQRTFSSSAFIDDFVARGVLNVDEDVINSEDLKKLNEWGGKWIGCGSARPQGFGRFSVVQWDEV